MRPIAVLISDIHYNMNTLALADAAMRMAINKANELDVSLVVAGDLHDTKANVRGECINAMRATFKTFNRDTGDVRPYSQIRDIYILRGNHDAINEKSKEHSLNFLADLVTIVDKPDFYNLLGVLNGRSVHLIPYQHDTTEFLNYLEKVDKGSCIIMHQGCKDSNAGDYIQDKSALPAECFKDFRVISGHYHTRQTIKTGRPQKGAVGLLDYIGNPFTLTYGEAQDPPKGFQILMDDGLLEFVPTNLRKHVVMEVCYDVLPIHPFLSMIDHIKFNDLVWVKVSGTREQLNKVDRATIKNWCCRIPESFRLDLIPTDVKSQILQSKNLTQGLLLDSLIDSLSNTSTECKERIKQTWKNLCE